MKNRKGFTLIELLVVIAIIGLLSTLAIISLGSARAKARDARRVSDVKQIQTALELYYDDQGGYPLIVAADLVLGGTGASKLSAAGFADTITAPVYMATVPANPTPNGADYEYNSYSSTDDSTCIAPDTVSLCYRYTIDFTIENNIPSLGDGTTCAASSTAMVCP